MKNLLAALRPHLSLPMVHYQAGGIEATYPDVGAAMNEGGAILILILSLWCLLLWAAEAWQARNARPGGQARKKQHMTIFGITQDEELPGSPPNPYVELWAAVVSQAVWDTQARDPEGKPTSEAWCATAWFLSDLDRIGFFRWVCQSFGADYNRAISVLGTHGLRLEGGARA